MDLNLLSVFVTVVNEGSLSAAARKLDIPVSSVSRAIVRLEEDLNTSLLLRSTRRISNTAAGEALYNSVAPLLTTLDSELERLGEKQETPTGEIRITAPVDLGSTILADAIAQFLSRYPEVTVHADLTNDVVDLVRDGFDLALRFSGPQLKDSSLIAKKAASMTGYLYASPTYLARRGTPRSPADLRSHDWVVFTRGPKTLELQIQERKFSLTPRGRVASNEFLFTRDLIRAGTGIGLLPSFLAEADIAAGALLRVLPRASVHTGYLWVVRPNARHVPAKVNAFKDFILEYVRSHPLAR